MDGRMSFSEPVDMPAGKDLAMLRECQVSSVLLVRLRLEYASCVWRHFYNVYVNRIERDQKKFFRYALLGVR
jgi:hypothetical protein